MKQHKLHRSEKPKPEERSGYATRSRTPLAKRHDRHTDKVYACPLCNPSAPDL